MIITSIDLEMNQPSQKIIEIGVCIGNTETGEILHKESIYVNPKEKLSQYIIDLTGIKQETVDNGVSLVEAYNKLTKLHKQHNSFMNPLTWGCGDVETIQKQVFTLKNKILSKMRIIHLNNWIFGRRYIDVKTLYVANRIANNKPPVGGLAKAMTKFNLKFNGRKHSGSDDALNTFIMFLTLIKCFKLTI